jgi:hypothetical protein
MVPGLIGGLLLVIAGSSLLIARRLQRESWDCCPMAEARLQSAGLCPSGHSKCSHVGYAAFTYRVADQKYSGICAVHFHTEQQATDFVEKCRTQTLAVRYKPERPSESYLFSAQFDLPPKERVL